MVEAKDTCWLKIVTVTASNARQQGTSTSYPCLLVVFADLFIPSCIFCTPGFGGYALYLFQTPGERTAFIQKFGNSKDQALAIEPFSQV